MVLTESFYEWQAAELSEELPYICTYKCAKGFIWYKSIKTCVKVVPPGLNQADSKYADDTNINICFNNIESFIGCC
jgi:hypothetical protein